MVVRYLDGYLPIAQQIEFISTISVLKQDIALLDPQLSDGV
jgi:hypothetical protein